MKPWVDQWGKGGENFSLEYHGERMGDEFCFLPCRRRHSFTLKAWGFKVTDILSVSFGGIGRSPSN